MTFLDEDEPEALTHQDQQSIQSTTDSASATLNSTVDFSQHQNLK